MAAAFAPQTKAISLGYHNESLVAICHSDLKEKALRIVPFAGQLVMQRKPASRFIVPVKVKRAGSDAETHAHFDLSGVGIADHRNEEGFLIVNWHAWLHANSAAAIQYATDTERKAVQLQNTKATLELSLDKIFAVKSFPRAEPSVVIATFSYLTNTEALEPGCAIYA